MKYTELYFEIQIIGGIICSVVIASVCIYYLIAGKIRRIKNRKNKKHRS